jgi:hypothetical protein
MNLSAAAVQSSFGVRSGVGRTLLPDGMDYPTHWHVAAERDGDSPEATAAYQSAWRDRLEGSHSPNS